MATRAENWSIGDYLKHFHDEAERATDSDFQRRILALLGELELLDSEFIKETRGCTTTMEPIFDELESINGRMGYCTKPRGFVGDCEKLYQDVEHAVQTVHKFRESCVE